MSRFEVIDLINGKYAIQDTRTGQFVRFGYNTPPLYVEKGKPATEWNNWYSAREFAKAIELLNPGASRGPINDSFNPIERY